MHLNGVKSVLGDVDANLYGPFIWEEDIFGKIDGIYRPIGRVILPLSVEGRDPENYADGRKGVAFTVFSEAYFAGDGCLMHAESTGAKEGNCSSLCDWDLSGYGEGFVLPEEQMFMLPATSIGVNDPLIAIKSHVERVLSSRGELEDLAKKTGTENLVKRTFIEY